MRAYTAAIASAMQLAERIERGLVDIDMDYADEARVHRWIDVHEAELTETAYGITVRFVIRMAAAARADAAAELRDLTNGRATVKGARMNTPPANDTDDADADADAFALTIEPVGFFVAVRAGESLLEAAQARSCPCRDRATTARAARACAGSWKATCAIGSTRADRRRKRRRLDSSVRGARTVRCDDRPARRGTRPVAPRPARPRGF